MHCVIGEKAWLALLHGDWFPLVPNFQIPKAGCCYEHARNRDDKVPLLGFDIPQQCMLIDRGGEQ